MIRVTFHYQIQANVNNFSNICSRENMPSHFKVKEYCPLVFRNLRERFGIDDLDYKESLTRYVSHTQLYLIKYRYSVSYVQRLQIRYFYDL